MNTFHITLSILVSLVISPVHPWSGILLNSETAGTQLYFPTTSPHSVGNLKFNIPPISSADAVMFNGRAYFIGGWDMGQQTPINNVTIFDPATNMTKPGPPLLNMRCCFATAVLQDSIVVCGGNGPNQSELKFCEKLTSTATKWVQMAPLPKSLSQNYMVTLNNKLYIFGGFDLTADCGLSNAVYMFDGTKWVAQKPMPVANNLYAAVALDNDRALICGGLACINGQETTTNTCSMFTSSTGTWTAAPSLSAPRAFFSMVVYSGKYSFFNLFENMNPGRIYALGGSQDGGQTGLSTVELYSTTTGGTVLPYPMAKGDADYASVVIV